MQTPWKNVPQAVPRPSAKVLLQNCHLFASWMPKLDRCSRLGEIGRIIGKIGTWRVWKRVREEVWVCVCARGDVEGERKKERDARRRSQPLKNSDMQSLAQRAFSSNFSLAFICHWRTNCWSFWNQNLCIRRVTCFKSWVVYQVLLNTFVIDFNHASHFYIRPRSGSVRRLENSIHAICV